MLLVKLFKLRSIQRDEKIGQNFGQGELIIGGKGVWNQVKKKKKKPKARFMMEKSKENQAKKKTYSAMERI